MSSPDIIADRLSRLEKVVNDISSKLDKVLETRSSSFGVPNTPRTPIPQSKSRFFNDGDEMSLRSGNNSGTWIRLYSKKKKEHFLYHSKTEKVSNYSSILELISYYIY